MSTFYDYVSRETTALDKDFASWKEAIRFAGGLLLDNSAINVAYVEDMVKLVDEEGPYIVIMPGLALAHARPNGNVQKNAIAIVTMPKGVMFGNSDNDPVKLLMAISAITDEEHLKLFQCIANYLQTSGNVEQLLNAREYSETGLEKERKNA